MCEKCKSKTQALYHTLIAKRLQLSDDDFNTVLSEYGDRREYDTHVDVIAECNGALVSVNSSHVLAIALDRDNSTLILEAVEATTADFQEMNKPTKH